MKSTICLTAGLILLVSSFVSMSGAPAKSEDIAQVRKAIEAGNLKFGEAVRKGDVSVKKLAAYPKAWHKSEGNNNAMSYKIKQVIDRFSDDDLNRLARILLELDPSKRTPFAIFKAALRKHPRLILDAAKIFI